MTSSQDRRWLVERVALDEAPAGTELTASERQRLAELASDDKAILATYPKAEVAAEVRRRLRVAEAASAYRRRRVATAVAPALAVAAALVLFVRVGTTPPGGKGVEPEVTRLKGGALVVHRKTADGSDVLRNRDVARAGDRIQLGFQLEGSAYVSLVSIDGRGVVTLHLPTEGQPAPVKFEPGRVQLPFSYELDDAPSFERFILVTSDGIFSVRQVQAAAPQLAAKPEDVAVAARLDLPPGLSQRDFVLTKETSDE